MCARDFELFRALVARAARLSLGRLSTGLGGATTAAGDLATRAQSELCAEQDPSDYDSLAGAVDSGRLVAERGRREVLTEGRGVKRPG